MPLLRIVTNVERKSIPDNFLEEATDMLAQAIGKPREKMRIVVIPDQLIAAGGERVPCAICDLISIGKLGPVENKTISKAICEFINSKLSIDLGRVSVVFFDKPGFEIGTRGTTLQ